MINEARQYVSVRSIIRKEPIYSANRFAALVSDIPVDTLCTEHLEQYRALCVARSLSPKTIESSISDLITVAAEFTGKRVKPGRRLRIPSPRPKGIPIAAIDAIWQECPQWLQQWIAVSYWTGFRLSDVMTLMMRETITGDIIQTTASKTRRDHAVPLPKWLTRFFPLTPPWKRATDYWRKKIRKTMAAACDRIGCDPFGPKAIRRLSINEWTRASSTAGAIIHGTGLGVMAHYLDPLSVLQSAAPRVRLPNCFGAQESSGTEETLLANFRRLDPSAQGLVAGTAERLAAG